MRKNHSYCSLKRAICTCCSFKKRDLPSLHFTKRAICSFKQSKRMFCSYCQKTSTLYKNQRANSQPCTLGWIIFFFLRILNCLMWHVLRGGVKITCSNSEFFLSAPSIGANQLHKVCKFGKKCLIGEKNFMLGIKRSVFLC